MFRPPGWLRRPVPVALVVLTLIGGAGLPALDNQFVTDDRNLFVYRDNQRWDRLGQIWGGGSRQSMEDAGENQRVQQAPRADTYRPLTLTSFVLDRELGGQSPRVFHRTSLALHLLACALLFVWLLRVAGLPAAATGTLLLGIHPAPAEAWIWINGRADLLCALFLLGALLLLDRGRALLAALAALGACLCKETALLALPLLALRPRWASDPDATPALRWRPGRALLALTAVAATYLALRGLALGGVRAGSAGGTLAAFWGRGPTLVLDGLGELLMPRQLALRPTREDLDLLDGWRQGAAGLALLVALAVLARGWRRWPALLWGGAGFALLVMAASPGVSFGGGRYLYLPLALLLPGLLPALAVQGRRLVAGWPALRRRAAAATLALGYAGALLLALLTVQRLYQNEVTLFEATVQEHPSRALGWGGLGLAYLDMGAPAQARQHLQRALQIVPDRPAWLRGLADACRQLKEPCPLIEQRLRTLGQALPQSQTLPQDQALP